MPTVNRAAIEEIATHWLPKIRDAMKSARGVAADGSNDQATFAETQPAGCMAIYAETAEAWSGARSGLERVLKESVDNTDRSAQTVLRMAQNYAASEARASGLLNDIARRLDDG
jgi:hypothetical protein